MNAGTIFLLLLLLACPLMMFFMHGRGGHGGHAHDQRSADPDRNGHAGHTHSHEGRAGHGCGHSDGDASDDELLEQLRRRRDELEREIRAREAEDVEVAAR